MPQMTSSEPINLAEKLGKIRDHWSPFVIAEMNDIQFKLAKFEGEFVWHSHDHTDEVFFVVAGEMEIGFRDRTITLREGEMFVVPRGVEHITRAVRECSAMIIEPRGVVNTGEAGGELTAPNDRWL